MDWGWSGTASEYLVVTNLLLESVIVSLLVLSAYRALQIRRSLSIGLYRRQALWTASVSVIFVGLQIVAIVFTYFIPFDAWIDLGVSVLQGAGIFILFGWIDNSTLISRRSDPLLRNSIRWTTIRRPLWVVLLCSYAVAIGISVGVILAGGTLAGRPSPAEAASLSVVLLVPFALGAVLLPLNMLRTGDLVLRRHLKWLSLLILSIFGVTLLFGTVLVSGQGTGFLDLTLALEGQPATSLAYVAMALVFGYSMLRSAGSLAPVNRITYDQ
jgi:hypothetical protein